MLIEFWGHFVLATIRNGVVHEPPGGRNRIQKRMSLAEHVAQKDWRTVVPRYI